MDYKDLQVWQIAMDLCEQTIRIADKLVAKGLFGLADQLRKTAISVPSNIAEGEGRVYPAERRQFLSHARGSLYELETQLLIARRSGHLIRDELFALISEERRKLDNYLRYLKNS